MRQNVIFPVIVLYKCKLEDAHAYHTLLAVGTFDRYMVYDNSPRDFRADAENLPAAAVYVRDERNGGLPKAYNTAARFAREHGYSRILLLDQDTVFPDGAGEIYGRFNESVALSVPAMKTVSGADFSPCTLSGWKTRAVRQPVPGIYSLWEFASVNSGMCIDLELFFKAGGYNERIVLDFADFEFQNRLRKYASSFEILPMSVVQDFSNDETDVSRLLCRYDLYLKSAAQYHIDGLRGRLRLNVEVLAHTLALVRRSGSAVFFMHYLTDYVFQSDGKRERNG